MLGLVQTTSNMIWNGSGIMAWVDRQIDQRMVQAGNTFVARAQSLAPVKTGTLRNSIDYQVIGRTLTIIVGAPWGVFQEFGTRYIHPHPFIRPALLEMSRIWGVEVDIHFNRTGGSQWGGIFAHGGELALPHGLSHKEREHVRRHVLPVLKKYHRGNVKRAKVRVRRFG